MNQQNHLQNTTYGHAVFINISKKTKEIIQESQMIKITMRKNVWGINQGDYKNQKWEEIFPHMAQCNAEKLFLFKNSNFQIISQIKDTQYANLKSLFIGNNKINNIQLLSSIQFKCLQVLSLGHNQIIQIKSLKKLTISTLKDIRLVSNPLIEINTLSMSKINLKQLKFLSLQVEVAQIPIHQDLSAIVKLSCESTQTIWITSNIRIKQAKIQPLLKSRFPLLQIGVLNLLN